MFLFWFAKYSYIHLYIIIARSSIYPSLQKKKGFLPVSFSHKYQFINNLDHQTDY